MTLQKLILDRITEHASNSPRNLQTRVGPSGIGNPCDHCLTAALVYGSKGSGDWLPFIGTAVHAALEPAFQGPEWLTEHKVTVGTVAGYGDITGSADLFHIPSGTVIDFKIVGNTTIADAKRNGSKPQYRAQINLYGDGFVRAGFNVNRTVIAYLPRNDFKGLSGAYFDDQSYDPWLATAALDRAEKLYREALMDGYAVTRDPADAYIAALPRAKGCFDCKLYPQEPVSVVQGSMLSNIMKGNN